MKKLFLAALAVFFTATSFAQCHSKSTSASAKIGSDVMYPNKDIVTNAAQAEDLSTLVAAVKAADLVGTLQSSGSFTVLAPVNDAFENLPEGTVSSLLKPESKSTLTSVLTYHVLSGEYDFDAISAAIRHGGGNTTLHTVQGEELIFRMNGKRNITITDANGNTANITTYDVNQSNGIVHVIDSVLLPS